ncbi:MAG: AAA family ATPase, partial [Candidatus Methylomirabilales bacterium]
MGVAGTGKSDLSKAILEQLWAVYLDNNFLADVFSPKSRTDERYLAVRENLYGALYRITEENLRIGTSVLLDAPHIKQVQDPEWRRSIQRLVDETGARLCVIRCYCREQVLRDRLEMRGEGRDRWKLENWEKFLKQEPPRAPIPFPHLELDTEDSLDANVARAVS